LRYIKRVKEENDKLDSKAPGFVNWTTFVHKYNPEFKKEHILIKDLAIEVIFWRYKTLMTQYKVSFLLSLNDLRNYD
jgi:hypothetical protein